MYVWVVWDPRDKTFVAVYANEVGAREACRLREAAKDKHGWSLGLKAETWRTPILGDNGYLGRDYALGETNWLI